MQGDPGPILREFLAYLNKAQPMHQERQWQTLAERTGWALGLER